MQAITLPNESKINPNWTYVTFGMGILLWGSPIFGLGIFLPIASLFLFRLNHTIRSIAFYSLVFQIISYLFAYSIDFACILFSDDYYCSTNLKTEWLPFFSIFVLVVSFLFLLLEAKNTLKRKGRLYPFSSTYKWSFVILTLAFLSSIYGENSEIKTWAIMTFSGLIVFIVTYHIIWGWFFYKKLNSNNKLILFLETVFIVSIVLLFAGVYFSSLSIFGILINFMQGRDFISIEYSFLQGDLALYFWLISLYVASSYVGREKRTFAPFRKLYASIFIHKSIPTPVSSLGSFSLKKKEKYAKVRNWIFPGWGLIYLNRYWQGFPILFIFLLSLFFSIITLTYYYDYARGTAFLSYFGLKPGIPDKEFIQYTSNPIVFSCFLGITIFTYYLSHVLLKNVLELETEPVEKRGILQGFNNNLALSFLFHLTLLAVIFIIPITVSRNSEKKRDISKDHFQPDKMEFYFIDPEIPDEVKDLNGGVVSGTETPNQEEGMQIPDEPVSDEGKVKGYVKRIKGKKLPKTYSNYISARMRGPEMFMDYWKRAPHPYSCVVAYTITTEGEIIDIYIVEASPYPEQDQLTIELIEAMSPVMPPPGVKGDVRVTELFWNGPIDPDAMPTPLQKEMVLMFDGRYMEEEP